MADSKAALIFCAGNATGAAIARRFPSDGYTACITRRSADKLALRVERIQAEGGQARAFGSDARDEAAMALLMQTIEAEVGPIEVAVFNIGANVLFNVTDTTERVYRKLWEVGGLAGLGAADEHAPDVARKVGLRIMLSKLLWLYISLPNQNPMLTRTCSWQRAKVSGKVTNSD